MRVRALIVTVALGLALASHTAMAQTTKSAKQSASHGSISGKLESYDPATRTMKIKSGKSEQQIMLSSNAVVHQGAKTLSTDELASRQGQNVKVRYTVTNNEKTADSVTLAGAPVHPATAKQK
ncbi:MAG: hypothetical protein WBC51_05180 [Vicinamibacterales bacterium]